MRALTVVPGKAGSAAISDVPEPPPSDGAVLVDTLAIGVCGTDRDIVSGNYGWPPEGRDRLVLGHESVGRVASAPDGAEVKAGDIVVGIVRRPDPVPCPSCAVLEWDMCTNGRYTERGIKQRDGYGSDRYRIEPDYVVRVDSSLGGSAVLLEPTSVVAKAWDHVERIGRRASWHPERVLVTGAGPVGLLAALLGVQRGLEVHVLDRVESGRKPDLVRALGAQYHTGALADACPRPDVVLECTGVGALVFDAIECLAPSGIVCLTGISSGGRALEVDVSALNKKMVLANQVIFGSVNANRRHYELAAEALAKADGGWLEKLVTRRVAPERWLDALDAKPDDVKVVVDFSQ